MNIAVNTFSYLDLLQKEFIKSPLNYTGGKFKLLNQIIPYFPKEIDTFVDLFSGGCNVAINTHANKIVANDINKEVVELYEYLKNNSIEKIKKEIDTLIKKYKLSESYKYGYEKYGTDSKKGLANYNKEKYLKLRKDYNNNPNPIMFYTLVIFAFNNQIRFNKSGKFNLPVNKRDFTLNMQKNLELFVDRLKNLDIEFTSNDFREVSISNNSFVYVDPPYLATTASYNENGGWSKQLEKQLLDYLDLLNSRGIKFALSNVLESKGNKNHLLMQWSEKYTTNVLNYSYSNCNYQTKNRDKNSTVEVLIINY